MQPSPTSNIRLAQKLSAACGTPFLAGKTAAVALRPTPAHAARMAQRLSARGIPALAQDETLSVNYTALREAIRQSGSSETEFFNKLAEDLRNATQATTQPVETRDGEPSQPQQRQRDQQAEINLAELAKELQENKAALQFRAELMQRIELQEHYEPGFDKAAAIAEANQRIAAVNRSAELALQAAKKRNDVAAARKQPPKKQATLEIHTNTPEKERALEQTLHTERMEKSLKQFLRGDSSLWQSFGLVTAPAPLTGLHPIEAVSANFTHESITAMVDKPNLREPLFSTAPLHALEPSFTPMAQSRQLQLA